GWPSSLLHDGGFARLLDRLHQQGFHQRGWGLDHWQIPLSRGIIRHREVSFFSFKDSFEKDCPLFFPFWQPLSGISWSRCPWVALQTAVVKRETSIVGATLGSPSKPRNGPPPLSLSCKAMLYYFHISKTHIGENRWQTQGSDPEQSCSLYVFSLSWVAARPFSITPSHNLVSYMLKLPLPSSQKQWRQPRPISEAQHM